MSRKKKKGPGDEPMPITADSRVSDVVSTYPEALKALIDMGFAPLKNPVARKTVARLFTLKQAAEFRGIDLQVLLRTLHEVTGLETSDEHTCAPPMGHLEGEGPVPALEGDISVLGLVPCPIRNTITERFDGFVRGYTGSTGLSVAWWMAGEGPGASDVRSWFAQIVAESQPERLPDLMIAVGTELFYHQSYGRALLEQGVFDRFPGSIRARPELAPLDDPEGILGLQFAVYFTLVCRPENLVDGRLPETWSDLAEPEFEGQVTLPTLELPIVPDLLGALEAHLGPSRFQAFARNVGQAMHPAQASPRVKKSQVPGVIILPLHFAYGAAASGGVPVLPKDGIVAAPGYMVCKKDANEGVAEVASYLLSRDYLAPYWDQGHFVPNHRDIEVDVTPSNLLVRPWDEVLRGDPDAETSRRIALVRAGGEG